MQVICVACGLAFSGQVLSAMDCEALKNKIEQKMQSKGVKSTETKLKIVDIKTSAEGKVVGTCQGKTKKIVYTK
ncbi:MAG TPA: hypothetical protein DCO68_11745 [Methylophilaceae bacterium]|nr:hypothetical protein [Methylophilaceae bacterium]HAJ72739.1 hypothetical protein [Methylophilaceae bacterium]